MVKRKGQSPRGGGPPPPVVSKFEFHLILHKKKPREKVPGVKQRPWRGYEHRSRCKQTQLHVVLWCGLAYTLLQHYGANWMTAVYGLYVQLMVRLAVTKGQVEWVGFTLRRGATNFYVRLDVFPPFAQNILRTDQTCLRGSVSLRACTRCLFASVGSANVAPSTCIATLTLVGQTVDPARYVYIQFTSTSTSCGCGGNSHTTPR